MPIRNWNIWTIHVFYAFLILFLMFIYFAKYHFSTLWQWFWDFFFPCSFFLFRFGITFAVSGTSRDWYLHEVDVRHGMHFLAVFIYTLIHTMVYMLNHVQLIGCWMILFFCLFLSVHFSAALLLAPRELYRHKYYFFIIRFFWDILIS